MIFKVTPLDGNGYAMEAEAHVLCHKHFGARGLAGGKHQLERAADQRCEDCLAAEEAEKPKEKDAESQPRKRK